MQADSIDTDLIRCIPQLALCILQVNKDYLWVLLLTGTVTLCMERGRR